jgi:hypothetical protein
LCLTSAQELEPALGIVEGRQPEPANDEVEDLPHPIPVERLTDANLRFGKCPRAAHDGMAVSRTWFQPFQVFDGGGEIGVGDENELSPALLDTPSHGGSLALIARQWDHTHLGVSPPLDRLDGSVHASIIDNQNLEWPTSRPHVGEHAIESRSDPRCFVVSRDDDR